jgi:hypothetical protein
MRNYSSFGNRILFAFFIGTTVLLRFTCQAVAEGAKLERTSITVYVVWYSNEASEAAKPGSEFDTRAEADRVKKTLAEAHGTNGEKLYFNVTVRPERRLKTVYRPTQSTERRVPAGKPSAGFDPDAAADRLDRRLQGVQDENAATLHEVGEHSENDVQSAIERVKAFRGGYVGIVRELHNDNVRDINALVNDYNRFSKEYGSGPDSGAFKDLKEIPNLPPPGTESTSKLGQEKILTVQAKLEELQLKSRQTELAEGKEVLEVEAQRIARDKEGGIDVSQREKELEGVIKSWEAERDDFQKKVDKHSATINELDVARKEIKDDKEQKLAEQKRVEKERDVARQRANADRAKKAEDAGPFSAQISGDVMIPNDGSPVYFGQVRRKFATFQEAVDYLKQLGYTAPSRRVTIYDRNGKPVATPPTDDDNK